MALFYFVSTQVMRSGSAERALVTVKRMDMQAAEVLIEIPGGVSRLKGSCAKLHEAALLIG